MGCIINKSIKTIIAIFLFIIMSLIVISDTIYAGQAVPGRVSVNSIRITNKKEHSVKVTWKRVKNAKKYKIRYRKANRRNKWTIKSTKQRKSKKASITLSKLKSNTKYCYQIRSINGSRKSKWSKIKSFKTKSSSSDSYDWNDDWDDSDISWTETYSLCEVNNASLPSIRFFDGVAWVRIKSDSRWTSHAALINENGDVIYLCDDSRMEVDETGIVDNIITTPFIKGLSAIYTSDGHNSNPGFVIVNQKGEEVYTCFDENILMCGQADDGNYILLRHETGFASDHWYISILDTDLKMIDTNIEAEESLAKQRQDIIALKKDCVYILDDDVIVNVKKGWMEDYYSSPSFLGRNENHLFVREWVYPNYIFSEVPIESIVDTDSASDFENLIKNTERFSFIPDVSDDSYIFSLKFGGCLYHTDLYDNPLDYVDFNNNVLMSFPKLPEEASYKSIDDFSDNYVAIYMIGADKKPYLSVIDDAGAMLYEPQQYDLGPYDDAFTYKGYIIVPNTSDHHTAIYDLNGKVLDFGDDLKGLSGDACLTGFGLDMNISNDYIWISGSAVDFYNGFVSLDGSNEISYARISYNDKGELVY